MFQVSVIVPCYNEEQDIPRCLTDLLSQDYENMEIIVVDDGSTDGTAQVVKRFMEKNPRLKLFSSGGRRGPANARNLGAKASSGEVLIFKDADAKTPDMHFVRNLVEPFEDSEVQVVLARSYTLIPTSSFLERSLILSHYGHRLRERGRLPEAYRRTVLLEVSGFDPRLEFGEDVDLADRVFARQVKVAYTKNPVQVGAEVRSFKELVERELWYGNTILSYLRKRRGMLLRMAYPMLYMPALLGVVLSLIWKSLLPISLFVLLLLLAYQFWKVALSIRNTGRLAESLFIPVLHLFQGLVLSVGFLLGLVRLAPRR